MSEWVKVTAQDGHELSAYVARPEGEAIGALVLVQEIYGINAHIRSVCDGYAKDGFVVVAPAIFDRFERGVELKYEGEDQKRAYELYSKLKPEMTLMDVAAAYEFAKEDGEGYWGDRVLLWRADGVGGGYSRGDGEDAAGVLRGVLRGRDWEVCEGGACLSGDAAFWRGR